MAISARFTFPAGAETKRKTGWLSEFLRSNPLLVPGRLSESIFVFFPRRTNQCTRFLVLIVLYLSLLLGSDTF
jgi:hypothetical protein